MKKQFTKLTTFAAIVVLIVSCSQEPKYTTQTLPSGRVVKVVGVMKMHFSNSESALMLKYFTDVSMAENAALQTEAEDIWQSFKFNVEKAGLTSAILSANEMPRGIISKTSSFNFVFKKEHNGEWTLTNDQKSSANKANSADAKSRAAD